MRIILVVFATLLATPSVASEMKPLTAGDLRGMCKDVRVGGQVAELQAAHDAGWCSGVMFATAHMLPCTPEGIRDTQMAEVFTAYANAHPERLHEYWQDVAIAALSEAFCKKS